MGRYVMCSECGKRMRRVLDSWGRWDGESYICDNCSSDGENFDNDQPSVWEAAEIWASHGKDEDYTFGYSEEELEENL